jgi:hypothetical protein
LWFHPICATLWVTWCAPTTPAGHLMKIRAFLILLLPALICIASSSAWCVCDQAAAQRVASQVTSDFAILVGFTKAACAPTTDGPLCSLACISDLNISGDNRNLVLTAITASAGKRMRDAGLNKFNRVSFADRELLLSRKALGISAAAASQLQQTLSSGSEPPVQKAARVGAAYTSIDIPASKSK